MKSSKFWTKIQSLHLTSGLTCFYFGQNDAFVGAFNWPFIPILVISFGIGIIGATLGKFFSDISDIAFALKSK